MDHSRGLLRLLERLFGVCQVVLGLVQLPLEEEPALGSFGDGEMLRQVSKLIDVTVGDVSSPARIAILHRNTDHAILAAAVYRCVTLEALARIGEIPLAVLLHQAESLHHRILDCAAFQHGDKHVVGIFEAETTTGQRGHATHGAQLRGQRGTHRGVLLRRQQRHSGGVAYRQKQRDHDRQDREDRSDPEDEELPLGENDKKIEQGDFVVLLCVAPSGRGGRRNGGLIQFGKRSFVRHRFLPDQGTGAPPICILQRGGCDSRYLSTLNAAAPSANWENICDQSVKPRSADGLKVFSGTMIVSPG